MTKSTNTEIEYYRRNGMTAVYLCACALNGTTPELTGEENLAELYKFCKFHTIASMAAMALEPVWKGLEEKNPELMRKWKETRDKAIRKNILLNAERERILSHLEAIGCWYMPLKGSLLQFDYPRFGMRQMNDNDILYDEKFQEEIHEFMLSSGYQAANYGKGNHDEYTRQPVYNIEMHKGLFMSSISPELSAYYQNIRSRMIPDANRSHAYHLSEEDFYIYLVAHAYKHYVHSGIGIRNLLDVYVFIRKHGDTLDWQYITREVEKFGAGDFERQCRILSGKLLSQPRRNPSLTETEQQELDIYLSSGTFGTKIQAMNNQLQSQSGSGGICAKIRYLWKRLFPPVAYMVDMEPKLAKHPWLIPFAYIRRLFRGVFVRSQDVLKEVELLKDANSEK